MRWIVLLGYIGLVVAGGAYIVAFRSGPQVEFTATRELSANRLIQSGDLTLDPDGRQYVTRKVNEGERIELSEISMNPAPAASRGRVPFSVSVPRRDVSSDLVNAGKMRSVCPSNVRAEIRAVFCGDEAEACIAVIDVATADAEKLENGPASERILQETCQ